VGVGVAVGKGVRVSVGSGVGVGVAVGKEVGVSVGVAGSPACAQAFVAGEKGGHKIKKTAKTRIENRNLEDRNGNTF